jgi:hypothetical protein
MMLGQSDSHSFIYVETDIRPDATIRQWQAQRAAERVARRSQEHDVRRRRLSAPFASARGAAAKMCRAARVALAAVAIRIRR